MAQFSVQKILKLDFLGQGWEQCSLTFKPFTFRELQTLAKYKQADQVAQAEAEKNAEEFLALLQNHFVEGKGLVIEQSESGEDVTRVVSVKADDLADLPADVIVRASKLLGDSPDPKS